MIESRDIARTDSSFQGIDGGNRLGLHSPALQRAGVDLTAGEDIILTVANPSLTSVLPNGTYLLTFVGYITRVDNTVETIFDDVRPLDAQGTAGTALTFADTAFSSVGTELSFFEETETLASFEFHNTDTDENVFTVDYTSEVVDFSQIPVVGNDSIVTTATDVRVQRLRLDGTTLRAYYGTDTTGLGDFTVELGELQNVPVESYADIAARNADTTLIETVFASVLDDTGDGLSTSTGNPATYILRTVPTAGQPTTNDNWARITSPDTILNEVQVGQYRPFLDTDGNPSRDPADMERPNAAADSNGYIYCEAGELSDTGGSGNAAILDSSGVPVLASGITEEEIHELLQLPFTYTLDGSNNVNAIVPTDSTQTANILVCLLYTSPSPRDS